MILDDDDELIIPNCKFYCLDPNIRHKIFINKSRLKCFL